MARARPVGSYTLEVSVPVRVKPQRAWKAFVRKTKQWWPAHFLSVPKAKRFCIEEKLGGLVYEDAGKGTGAAWGNVVVWMPPERITLALEMYPDWAGPGRSFVTVIFQETKTGTTLILSDNGICPDAAKAATSLETGWTELLTKHFKPFVESAKEPAKPKVVDKKKS